MRRWPKIRATWAIPAVVMAIAVGGCGDDGGNDDIGQTDAGDILDLVAKIRSQVDAERCDEALQSADQLEAEVTDLTDASQETVDGLTSATESLKSLIASDCVGEPRTTSTTTTTTTTEDTTEETSTTTTETETVPTTTETEETTTTDEETTTDEDDDDTGGTPGAGGVGAPSGGGGGESE